MVTSSFEFDGIKEEGDLSTAPHFTQKICPASATVPHPRQGVREVF